ncbi:hypothetical protein [Acetobacter pomorum]|uniref:hypothetical protein n=1 Tax=Acetobacter pomorum TaxID=65959 RepID=UPI00117831AA|nr:hypothetical protein [Acetobacter pomorum]
MRAAPRISANPISALIRATSEWCHPAALLWVKALSLMKLQTLQYYRWPPSYPRANGYSDSDLQPSACAVQITQTQKLNGRNTAAIYGVTIARKTSGWMILLFGRTPMQIFPP